MAKVPYGTRFPEYISLLPQFCFWELDQIGVFAGVLFFSWFLVKYGCLIVTPTIAYYYSSAKKNSPAGFMQQLLYSCGLSSFDGYPSYFEKHFSE